MDSSLTSTLLQSLCVYRNNNEFSDLTIEVEGSEFKAHKIILIAFSGYFQGLFGSQWKESEDNSVKLEALTKETFEFILTALYECKNVVDIDNCIDVWLASDMLLIPSLKRLCETFIKENITEGNCVNVYQRAMDIGEPSISKLSKSFILQHFDSVRECNSKCLLYMHFEELKSLIESDDLATKSEDFVVDLILDWVSHDTNSEDAAPRRAAEKQEDSEEAPTSVNNKPRSELLYDLLTSCRLRHVSGKCLLQLMSDVRLQSIPEVKELIMNCIKWKMDHGDSPVCDGSLWSQYRSCGEYQNILLLLDVTETKDVDETKTVTSTPTFGVFGSATAAPGTSMFGAKSSTECLPKQHNSSYKTTVRTVKYASSDISPKPYKTFNGKIISSVVWNNQLFIVLDDRALYSFSLLTVSAEIEKIKDNIVTGTDVAMIVAQSRLYLIGCNVSTSGLIRAGPLHINLISLGDEFSPSSPSYSFSEDASTNGMFSTRSYLHLAAHGANIVVFTHDTKAPTANSTLVRGIDSSTHELYGVDTLAVSPVGLATFHARDDTAVFALCRNGGLWKIKENPTTFRFEMQPLLTLWQYDRPLCGAVITRGALWVLGKAAHPAVDMWEVDVGGVFTGVRNIKVKAACVLNAVMLKRK